MKADCRDSPLIRNTLGGKVIEIYSLMSTVEVAHSDMNDTPLEGRSVIGGHIDPLRMQGQCCVTERNACAAALGDKAWEAVVIAHWSLNLPRINMIGTSSGPGYTRHCGRQQAFKPAW
jgi:hypothetical protein